ncbi:hypothetical protein AVEN_247007-1 [Araneus ventricosus]|uniref:PiggyBac transposable element-derived protein domain-containing protein n=1 Tax=Araneus ventricosus TaxID=182803 RepID=A0A4Y2JD53_ARAVE|nr:hypothetical protein AVEN_247007-1 [Araneus ventricosus]
MSDEMVKDLVNCTNIYITWISGCFSRERDAKSTTEAKMKAFIGLLCICGVHKSSHVNITDLWATYGTGIEILRTTMSSKRFLFLLRYIRFEVIHDRQSRKEN